MAEAPAPAPAPRPSTPRVPTGRGPVSRLGLWLLSALWPAIALFLGVAFLLWDRAERRVVWILAGSAALLFLLLLSVLRRRLRAAGRSVGNAVRAFALSFAVAALVVLVVWYVFLRK